MTTKELQITSYEQAKKIKEAGFDWETMYAYNGIMKDKKPFLFKEDYFKDWNYEEYSYSAPTVALALKWFRDKKNSVAYVSHANYHAPGKGNIEKWYNSKSVKKYEHRCSEIELFDTYEEAESALLDKLLELIKTE